MQTCGIVWVGEVREIIYQHQLLTHAYEKGKMMEGDDKYRRNGDYLVTKKLSHKKIFVVENHIGNCTYNDILFFNEDKME